MAAAGRKFASIPSAQPSAPATSAMHSDSTRNDTRMLVREKPRARSVAISRVRWATTAYMVFIAPNTAPTAITTATNSASASSAGPTSPAWSS